MKVLCGKNKNGPPLSKKSRVVLSLKIGPSSQKIWLPQKFSQREKLISEKKTSQDEAEADLCMNWM